MFIQVAGFASSSGVPFAASSPPPSAVAPEERSPLWPVLLRRNQYPGSSSPSRARNNKVPLQESSTLARSLPLHVPRGICGLLGRVTHEKLEEEIVRTLS